MGGGQQHLTVPPDTSHLGSLLFQAPLQVFLLGGGRGGKGKENQLLHELLTCLACTELCLWFSSVPSGGWINKISLAVFCQIVFALLDSDKLARTRYLELRID